MKRLARLAPDFLAAFRQHLLEAERSPNTVRGYLDDLDDFGTWFERLNAEPFTAEAVTPSDVRAYKQQLLDRKLKPATINRRLASLSAFARWAVGAGQIESNPLERIQAVAQVPASPKWLDRKQRFSLRRAVEREWQWAAAHADLRRALWRIRDASLVALLVHTGLRVAELAALDQDDVVLKPRSGQLSVRGKGAKLRAVPLNAEARLALGRWLAVRPAAAATPAVLVSQPLARMTTRSIERVVEDYARRAKLERLTPHMLRHTFAKSLLEGGVPLDQVATLLGHSNLNTTRIYTTPSAQDLANAVEALVET
ncbi:MAG: tyrosine-type recombinase/integrase [Anaerolineales bacterium]|nr:tyrosine-type recombinase/integrase [Anaerolineales bacterium]